jgi:sugar transferase (PEP-CTERM/EpsH1 system associated)
LVLTPQLPYPPHKGTTIRNYNLIAGLAQEHHVHLLSFVTPEDDLAGASPLKRACETIHTVPQPVRTTGQRIGTTLTSGLPDMAHRLASPAYASKLRQLLSQRAYDVVEFEGIEMIPYLQTVRASYESARVRPLLVFDDHNAEYLLQRRVFEMDAALPRRWPGALYSLVQWIKLRRYEAWACRHVDAVVAVSEPDAEALQCLVPGLGVSVVPNGVDIAAYARDVSEGPVLPSHSLVFTGTMDFRPNVDAVLWFANRVFPTIRQQVADAHFYIVGRRPHRWLASLSERDGIVVTGQVPDTRPYIGGAAIYVVPLRSGGGTRLKVLVAMAMRRAIVSTSMGCDGFPVTAGREVLLADEPRSFAQQVVSLLCDPARCTALGRTAYEFARRHYDWSVIVPRLEQACRARSHAAPGAVP